MMGEVNNICYKPNKLYDRRGGRNGRVGRREG
jgi:hypothetical protein